MADFVSESVCNRVAVAQPLGKRYPRVGYFHAAVMNESCINKSAEAHITSGFI